MIARSVESENPLYKKLCSRFSYDGKTVGEMMLDRADEYAAGGKPVTSFCDVTAESSITKANVLPRSGTAEVAVRRPLRPAFTRNRINPSAALAVVLAFFIIAYLFAAGISHHTDLTTPDVIAASAVEIEVTDTEADTATNP